MAEVTVRLSPALADLIERKLRSGDYTTASAVIEDGLQALADRDAGLERWLHDEILPGHAEYVADPTKAVPAEDLLDRIKARRDRAAE